jgi:HTH-type transcriptional regulator/antitoxin MqsA
MMKCTNCGYDGTEVKTADVPYSYRGRDTVIRNVTGEYCPSCGETVLDKSDARRVSAAMVEFNTSVNGGKQSLHKM